MGRDFARSRCKVNLVSLATYGADLPEVSGAEDRQRLKLLSGPLAPPRESLREVWQKKFSELPRGKWAIALSGGVDSSFVASMATKLGHKPIAVTLRTGSGFQNAQELSRQLGLELLVLEPPDSCELLSSIGEVVSVLKTPSSSTAPFLFYYLFKSVAALGFDGILTGDGADELFLGHATYQKLLARGGLFNSEGRIYEDYALLRNLRVSGLDSEFLSSALLPPPAETTPWSESPFAKEVLECLVAWPTASQKLRAMDLCLRLPYQCVALQSRLASFFCLHYAAPFAWTECWPHALAREPRLTFGKRWLREQLAEFGFGFFLDPIRGAKESVQPPFSGGMKHPGTIPRSWEELLSEDECRRWKLFKSKSVLKARQWSAANLSAYLPRLLHLVATTHRLCRYNENRMHTLTQDAGRVARN